MAAIDLLGPGATASTREVVFTCAWPGKTPIYIGNFLASASADEAEMQASAMQMIAEFTRDHFPDGVAPPVVLEIKPGALRWIPDDEPWRRR